MGTVRTNPAANRKGPSTFALLIDDINKMSESEQKSLWIQINKEKLSVLSKEIDTSVTTHNFSSKEIDAMINEARKNGNKKKKG